MSNDKVEATFHGETDPYLIVSSSPFKAAVEAMAAHEKIHPRAPLDALLLVAWDHLPVAKAEVVAEEEKKTGYPAGVEWSRAWPDDTEADEAIAESETFLEALFEIASKYNIPVTNNEIRWQDGLFLRHVGDFIGDVQDAYARFPAVVAQNDEALSHVIDNAFIEYDAVAPTASPADHLYFTEGFARGFRYARKTGQIIPDREALATTLYVSDGYPEEQWSEELPDIAKTYYANADAVIKFLAGS